MNSKYKDIVALLQEEVTRVFLLFFFSPFDGVGEGKHYALMEITTWIFTFNSAEEMSPCCTMNKSLDINTHSD